MKDWKAIATAGGLAAIDLRFAEFCRRRDGGDQAALLAISAALLSYQRSRGSSCIELGEWAGLPFPHESNTEGVRLPLFPERDKWQAALAASSLVGNGERPTPLVLDEVGRLYLYRFWAAERTIAKFIRQQAEVTQSLPPQAPQMFARFFGQFGQEPDWQAAAALAGLRGSFAVITGGPGTGKTTTVAKMLALLSLLEPQGRIALAAPTGKAASRLSESLQAQMPRFKLDKAHVEAIPTEVKTLHRLLGYAPRRDQFTFNRWRPLPWHTVVIDEASMVDLLLMAATIEALPPGCRLVLLGDHDQLASVDTGQVLGDIIDAAATDRPHGLVFSRDYQHVTGQGLPAVEEGVPALRDTVVRLEKSYRFGAGSGIGSFSRAVREGDPDAALAVLTEPNFADAALFQPGAAVEPALDCIWPYLTRYCQASSPQEALQLFGEAQVLCGLRHGRLGVEGLNAAVVRRLASAGFDTQGDYYRGRPVLITVNDYHNKLFNGDIGICWPENGKWVVFFAAEEGTLRQLPVSRLPRHESAWAMTVHKNQGSEFDHVLFFLPDSSSPLCHRELLYTGITRARSSLILVAEEGQVRQAVITRALRGSGLATRLLA